MPCPYWSVLPYLNKGWLQVVLGDYHFDQRALGSRLLTVYPSTRRATRKINAFIEHLRNYLQLAHAGLSAPRTHAQANDAQPADNGTGN
ncbi:hypothetical protein [Pseudomonas capeferrum]|uniref:hypothetical protein n=1 Tax=Pseudomonas capeferrum TaxID=1495066 RepID=UPI0035C04E8F